MIQRGRSLMWFFFEFCVGRWPMPVRAQTSDVFVGIDICPNLLTDAAHLKNRIVLLFVI
jgi:hypothetical protein